MGQPDKQLPPTSGRLSAPPGLLEPDPPCQLIQVFFVGDASVPPDQLCDRDQQRDSETYAKPFAFPPAKCPKICTDPDRPLPTHSDQGSPRKPRPHQWRIAPSIRLQQPRLPVNPAPDSFQFRRRTSDAKIEVGSPNRLHGFWFRRR
jgi:hypothetical protein